MEQMERSTETDIISPKLSHHRSFPRKEKARDGVPFEMVKAGLHWSRRMSRHMLPLELMFGW